MVAGHRRKKAADLAGLAKIPCIVRQLTDECFRILNVRKNAAYTMHIGLKSNGNNL